MRFEEKLQMKRKMSLLCLCICICLSACTRELQEDNPVRDNQFSLAPSEENMDFLDKYQDVSMEESAEKVALIYLDADTVPELLVLKGGEYELYFWDGSHVKKVAMPDTEIKVNAYGPKHSMEWSGHQTPYWFEYVPYQGLVRVHGGNTEERYDVYLRYETGSFSKELETRSIGGSWNIYDAGEEISQEEFSRQLVDLGYDQLVPCGYLYGTVADAYDKIDAVWDTKKVLEDFVDGKIDALCCEKEGFSWKNYEEIYEYATCGEPEWGRIEYTDFDNDGEDELVLHGYVGSCRFFDVIGDTVYEVLKTSATTDRTYVVEVDGERVLARTDLTHTGRKNYEIMKYDACCCVTDWFWFSVEYEGESYSEEDEFRYMGHEITMEEYEELVDSIDWLTGCAEELVKEAAVNEYFFQDIGQLPEYELIGTFDSDLSGTASLSVTEVSRIDDGTLYFIHIVHDSGRGCFKPY